MPNYEIYFPLLLKLHMKFWKYFERMVLYTVGSDYYRVLDFFIFIVNSVFRVESICFFVNLFFFYIFECNWMGVLGKITPPSRKNLPFLKDCFASFCRAIKRYYHVALLLKVSIGTAKIIHNESFNENNSSITA